MISLPPLMPDPPMFNGIKLSTTRWHQLVQLCQPFPRTLVGVFGGVTVYTDPLMPDSVAALMNGDRVVGIISLEPQSAPADGT